MAHYITRNCPVCNKEYQADVGRLKHGRQTTCSRDCSYKLRAQKQIVDVELSCLQCGAIFHKKPFQIRHDSSFCSIECYHAYRNPGVSLDKKCANCGKPFHARHHRIKHCSRKCFEIAHRDNMVGENNPSYVDGRSYDTSYDAGANWKRLRRKVYKRDSYICQICGVKCMAKNRATERTSHRIIQCHHIDPYKQSQDNSMNNLITLCIRCHRDVHNGKVEIVRATST